MNQVYTSHINAVDSKMIFDEESKEQQLLS